MSEFENDQGPSRQENEYFAREDVERIRRLAQKQKAALASQEQAKLQALHHLKCPKCGLDLHALKRGDLEVETCFNCHGVWLDAGELEHIIAQPKTERHSLVEAVLNLFRNAS